MKIIIFTLLAAFACALHAQSPFKTTTVSVFKNGSGFFTKEATLSTEDSQYFLEGKLPQGAYGTLWFLSPTGELKQVQSHVEETKETKEVRTPFHSSDFGLMLKANLNKTLTLTRSNGQPLTGKVQKIDGNFFIFQTDDEWLNLRTNTITQISFPTKPQFPDSVHIEKKTITKAKAGFLLTFASQKVSQPLEMMYLENGIGWMPVYHLDIQDDDKADLTLQAVVVNDAEDIEQAKMQFVVGVPNFIHANQVSPLAQSTNLNGFLNSIGNPQQTQFNDFATRGGSISYGIENATNQARTQGAGLEGSSTEDLFFYTLPDVSLKKGDRAFYTVLEAEVPIQHIYEVRLGANNADHYYHRNRRQTDGFSFEENFKNKVWHTLKLTNSTNTPMTSGSVMVTKTAQGEKRPISQDKITYTPVKGETFLKLTAAPDVSVRDAEKEVKRVEKAKLINGTHYDLITVEGQIRLHNYKNKAIDLNVRRQLSGELKTSDPKWLTAPRVPTHGQFNQITDVCWELKLKAGEKQTVTYQYTVLVRHR